MADMKGEKFVQPMIQEIPVDWQAEWKKAQSEADAQKKIVAQLSVIAKKLDLE